MHHTKTEKSLRPLFLALAALCAAGARAEAPAAIEVGNSETFTTTDRKVFGHTVVGYRVDTWDDATGWQKGEVRNGRSITLDGEDTIRRLVCLWADATDTASLVIVVR